MLDREQTKAYLNRIMHMLVDEDDKSVNIALARLDEMSNYDCGCVVYIMFASLVSACEETLDRPTLKKLVTEMAVAVGGFSEMLKDKAN